MKTMTNNLKYFGGLTLVLSVAFFYYLHSALHAQSFSNIWLFAILYGVILFIAGLVLGYKDPIRRSRADLSFQYHLMTFIIVNIIGIPWLFISMGLNNSTLLSAAFQCVPWSIGLFLHYYFSSRSIKGMNKKEIFD